MPRAKKTVEEAKVAEENAEVAAKKPRTRARKVVEEVKEAAKLEKKTKKAAAPKGEVIIQSSMGGEITPADVLAKVGPVDKVYVRVDLNKAFWVKGEETGSVDLW